MTGPRSPSRAGRCHGGRDFEAEIVALTERGELEPVVDRTFSFEEAQYAHAYIQERRNFGKVLLAP